MRADEVTICVPTIWEPSRPCDLAVMIESLRQHVPSRTPVLVAARDQALVVESLDGRLAGRCRIRQQPLACANSGAAWDFAVRAAETPYVVLASDDSVWHPHTFEMLVEDWEKISGAEGEPGLLGVRSDVVENSQNVRSGLDEGSVHETEVLVPVAALARRQTLIDVGGFPHGNSWSDVILCRRLRRAGHRLWVSRAYVHHIGQRSPGGVDFDYDFVRREDPQLYTEITGEV